MSEITFTPQRTHPFVESTDGWAVCARCGYGRQSQWHADTTDTTNSNEGEPVMGKITTTITADKEGFLANLRERADYFRSVADDERTALSQKERFRYRGQAEGVELAMSLVEDWQVAPS